MAEALQERSRAGRGPSSWLARPAGRPLALLLGALILALPAWVLADELRYSSLLGDDFAYIAEAIDGPTTRAYLFEPHNTHVVPLFRLWTAAIVAFSGSLEAMPATFREASYLGLVATMLAVYRLVAGESGRTGLGLAAMAGLGISTVVEPAVTWFSAGQALVAGGAIVVTLLLARGWSRSGGAWRLGLLGASCLAASAFWSGGLLAGPAAAAYLLARDGVKARRGVVVLGLMTLLAVLVVVLGSRRELTGTKQIWEEHKELWPRPVQAWSHTFQAIEERLLLANLGLDALTTPAQALAVVGTLAGVCWWSRGGIRGFNPLMAAGGVTVVGSYLLVYYFRGNFPYSSVRDLGWYHAIPQVGFAIFVAGWWDAERPRAGGRRPGLTRGEAAQVLAFVGLLCVLQTARAERVLIEKAPTPSAGEARKFPIPSLLRLRALYFASEVLDRQERTLARLDRARGAASRLGLDRATLRRIYGRVLVPGIPARQLATDAFSLLAIPDDSGGETPDMLAARRALDDLVRPEAEPRPPWLEPGEAWPRP